LHDRFGVAAYVPAGVKSHREPGSVALSAVTGKLYLSLLLISSGKVDFARDAMALELTAHESDRGYFERCYETAYRFVFNKFVTDSIDHHYLGSRVDESGSESLGSVRTDFVLQDNDFFETRSLHVHVCFENSSFDISNPGAFDLPAIATFARGLYRQHRADIEALPSSLQDFVGAVDKYAERRTAYDISQYLYISVCGQMLPTSDWRNVALPLWTLLWFQARGVAADAAVSYLEENSWRAGDFFWNFHQPGGMVTLSTPYPRLPYLSELDHFLPTLESLEGRDGSDPRLQDYDSLPEYPPLRYLALPVLEHAGWIEEALRDTSNELLELGRKRLGPVRAVFKSRRIEHRLYRSQVLDVLKLPVSRGFALALMDDKKLDAARQTTRDLQVSALNIVLLTFTIVGLLIAVISFVRQFA
jgi:hypothetical protein